MKPFIYSAKISDSARALADALATVRLGRVRHSRFKGDRNKVVVNWGHTSFDAMDREIRKCGVILNKPEFIANASNKLRFFRTMNDYPEEHKPRTVPWTSSLEEANAWLARGHKVFSRTLLSSKEGNGIVVNDLLETTTCHPCSLYTRYVPKRDEYRVHVFDSEVIDVVRKALRRGVENPNWLIRSWNNGFVFARENVVAPDDVLEQAKRAVYCCGLDFGAVDVIWNERNERAYVVEVNTAPGIEGTTLQKYREAIERVCAA